MRTTLRKVAQAVAVAGVCAGLTLTGSTTAVAAPATGDGTQSNLLYSVDGGTSWSDTVTAQRGQQVLARLFYDTTKDTTVTGTSLTTQIPDGFTYVPGSTRNVLAPGSDVATGAVSSETKAAAVADSVWSGDQLQVSPSAGFNGESNASQTGVLRNGTKRYLNLHQCNWSSDANGDMRYIGNTTASGDVATRTGTKAANTADTSLSCGPGSAPYGLAAAVSSVQALDLLGNRYLNLHQCNWSSFQNSDMRYIGNTTATGDAATRTGTKAANTADTSVNCGPGAPSAGYGLAAAVSSVQALDLLGNRYLNLHQCNWSSFQNSDMRYIGNTTATGDAAYRTGTKAANTADTSVNCGPGAPSGGYGLAAAVSSVTALDLLDAARGQGFVEFAFTSDVPAPPACEETITEPAVTSTRQGVLNGSGTGTPSSTAAVTLAEYTATGDACPEELAANTDEYTTVQDADLSGNVLDNDVVPAGSTVTVTGPNAGPWRGDLVLNTDGTFTYTPAPGFVGTDSFSYTVTDQDGNTVVGTVNITITEDENGIPLLAPGAAAAAGLLGLGGLGLYRRRERQTV